MKELTWITVARLPSGSAERAQAELDAAGIPAIVLDSHVAAVRPSVTRITGGVRVQVLLEDVEAAEAILRAFVQREDEESAAEPPDTSRQAHLHRALVFGFFGFLIAFVGPAISLWHVARFLSDRRPSRWTDWVILVGVILLNLLMLTMHQTLFLRLTR